MRRRILSLALLALLSRPAFAAGESERAPLRLRVLTYNVWGVPWITPLRSERMAQIPKSIAALAPDLVAIEEAWTDEDASVLMAGLSQAGLTHQERHQPDWPNQNGLIIASRYPLRDFRFKPFTQGRRPHVLWHLDYFSAKGVAQVKVETPIGLVGFAATHLQAAYGTRDYDFVQMSQALEAADELADRADPMIFAGDVNSAHDGIPSQLLAGRADLTPCDPEFGIDQILYRDGTFISAHVASVRKVLTEPVDLGSASIPLSDHPGILAEIDLTSCEGSCSPATLKEHFQKLETEVLPLLDGELSRRNINLIRDSIVAAFLPIAGVLLVVWRRRSLGRSCRKSHAAAALMLMFSLWFGYLFVSFGPTSIAGLMGIKGRLASTVMVGAQPILSRSGS